MLKRAYIRRVRLVINRSLPRWCNGKNIVLGVEDLSFYSKPCSHKSFEHAFCNCTPKKDQSDHCIKYSQCFDWTILEYEFKACTLNVYDSKVWSCQTKDYQIGISCFFA